MKLTYSEVSDVQRRVAQHLFDLWQKYGLKTAHDVLEIGPGTGYFTSLFRPKLPKDARLTLWDIAPQTPETAAVDAEEALPTWPGKFNAIVGSSVMQWFRDPAAFLRAVADHLNPGGMAVLSTYGPATFGELAEAGLPGLHYYSLDELKAMVPPSLEILEAQEGRILKLYPTPLDALRVAQALSPRSTGGNALEAARNYPLRPDGRAPLTYEPVYLVLRR